MGEFGNTFRKEREKQGISLDDVSSATKISSRMLRAIEEENFDQLPGGVFNKGFIRAYAKHLGMNDDDAVAGYIACLHQSQLEAQTVWDPQVRPASQAASNRRGAKSPPPQTDELPELQLPRAEHVSPPRRDYFEPPEHPIPWRILALALLVIVLAAVLWHRHSRGAHSQAAVTIPPVVAATKPVSPPEISPPPITTVPSRTRPPAATPISSRPSAPRISSVAGTEPATKSAAAAAPSNVAASEITTKSVELLNSQESAPLNLLIRASEDSWISVSADGQPVLHETLIAPAHTSVHASREIVIRVGNAAGVTFSWNGQEIPAQGAEAEVKTLVFDANGMRVLPAPASDQNP